MADAGGENRYDLWTLSAEGGSTKSFYAAPSIQAHGVFSPDGKWVAYNSFETWPPTIWIQPFPATGGRTEIGRGLAPLWSRDGPEILYVQRTGRRAELVSVSVSVKPESGLSFGRPVPLNVAARLTEGTTRNFDVTPDGRQFRVVHDAQESDGAAPRVNIVRNWHEELKRVPKRARSSPPSQIPPGAVEQRMNSRVNFSTVPAKWPKRYKVLHMLQ